MKAACLEAAERGWLAVEGAITSAFSKLRNCSRDQEPIVVMCFSRFFDIVPSYG